MTKIQVLNLIIDKLVRVIALLKYFKVAMLNPKILNLCNLVKAILISFSKILSTLINHVFKMDNQVLMRDEKQGLLLKVYRTEKEEHERANFMMFCVSSREPIQKIMMCYEYWVVGLGGIIVLNISNMKMLSWFVRTGKLNNYDDTSNERAYVILPIFRYSFPKIFLVAIIFVALMLLLPYDPKGDTKVPKIIFNNHSPTIFHGWVISTMVAYCGSIVGLKLMHKKPKLANFSGYVAVFAVLSALAIFGYSIMV